VVLATPITAIAKTKRVDPAFMLKYQWTPDVNTYVRYARGFRDGGANVRSSVFNAYQTESLDSFEIGLKSQWFDRRVTLNTAVFRNIVSNQQQTIQSNPAVNPSVTDTFNLPLKYKATGVEVELSIRPLPGLQLSGNYTYIHSNTRRIGLDPGTLTTYVPTGVTVRADGGLIPSAADIVAHPNSVLLQLVPSGAPKHSGSISMDYAQPVGTLGNLGLHLEWVRATKAYVASPFPFQTFITNGVATPKPVFLQPTWTNRVNGRLALRDIPLANGTKAELALWGKNIFNHVDIAHSYSAGNALTAAQPAPQSAIYLQPPRTYGVELRVQF